MDPIDKLMRSVKLPGERRAADRAPGEARIGGWLNPPDYLRAYLRAGAVLAREAASHSDIAIVCTYVQRHALELLIKDLIGLFYGIGDSRDKLARIADEATASTEPSNKARERLTQCHNLEQLLRDLNCVRQHEVDGGSQYREPPTDLADLVTEFTRLEGGIAETFRYPNVKLRPSEAIHVRTRTGIKEELVERRQSFKDEAVIPVSSLQARLEALVDGLFWKPDDDLSSPIDSLGYELMEEYSALLQELYHSGEIGVIVPDPNAP